jgi:hypothetical protein
MKTITSARSLRGNDRLISGQVKIGGTCAAKDLFSDKDGNKIPCSDELVAADPRHLTGTFTTLCTAHLPLVENDLDELWADGHAFGPPNITDRTEAPGGLEENYRRKNIEKPVRDRFKKIREVPGQQGDNIAFSILDNIKKEKTEK